MFKRFFIFTILLLPSLTLAHVNGLTIERTEGNYFIDVGSTETVIHADKSTRFDFAVYLNPNKGAVDYDSVYVKIMNNGEFVFTATLPKQSLGSAGMTYTFPAAGTYDMTLLFQKGTQKITETTFPLDVTDLPKAETGSNFDFTNPIFTFVVGAILGLIGQWFASRLLNRKTT